MTPEPRDLTERRVEAIEGIVANWEVKYPSACAKEIIAADPATAELELTQGWMDAARKQRATDTALLAECREVLECVHDTYDMFGESQHKLPKDHVAIRTRALLQRLGGGNG